MINAAHPNACNLQKHKDEYIKCRKNCAAHGEASHCYGRTGWAYSCLMMRNAFIAAGKPM